jgi:hypothetical protein
LAECSRRSLRRRWLWLSEWTLVGSIAAFQGLLRAWQRAHRTPKTPATSGHCILNFVACRHDASCAPNDAGRRHHRHPWPSPATGIPLLIRSLDARSLLRVLALIALRPAAPANGMREQPLPANPLVSMSRSLNIDGL